MRSYRRTCRHRHCESQFRRDFFAGANIWCGRLERAGCALLRVGRPAAIDVAIGDDDEPPFWGGLRVVHLPGHTLGHGGFYSARHDLLFSK